MKNQVYVISLWNGDEFTLSAVRSSPELVVEYIRTGDVARLEAELIPGPTWLMNDDGDEYQIELIDVI